jgi:hypothetical protein
MALAILVRTRTCARARTHTLTPPRRTFHRLPILADECDSTLPGLPTQRPREFLFVYRCGPQAPVLALWKAVDGTMSGMLVPPDGKTCVSC